MLGRSFIEHSSSIQVYKAMCRTNGGKEDSTDAHDPREGTLGGVQYGYVVSWSCKYLTSVVIGNGRTPSASPPTSVTCFEGEGRDGRWEDGGRREEGRVLGERGGAANRFPSDASSTATMNTTKLLNAGLSEIDINDYRAAFSIFDTHHVDYHCPKLESVLRTVWKTFSDEDAGDMLT